MFRHFVPSRWLHPLATLVRLSPVDLPSANGFDKPFAASKFEKENWKLTKECDYMGKAILAAIVTLIVGYLGTVVGLELLGNWYEFGLLIAIAVMGAFIIYFNDKK